MNKSLVLVIITIILSSVALDLFREPGVLIGKAKNIACVRNGKSDIALVFQVVKHSSDLISHINIKFDEGRCVDRKDEIKKGDSVRIYFSSINGRFVTIYQVVVNNKHVIEARGFKDWKK